MPAFCPHLAVLMPAKPPAHTPPGSPDALTTSSVRVSPKVPGVRPPPFHQVLLVSCLCASCSTSRGSWALPLDTGTCSQLCALLRGASRLRLHPRPCHEELGTRPAAHAWGRRGHAVERATHSPTFLTRPQVFSAHLLRARPCTELQLTQKSSVRRMLPQQQQQLGVPGLAVLGTRL